jgi:uncharacterized protein (DUF433 family)
MTKYIVSDPHILSGTPVIVGTRIPVARIMALLKQGYALKDIHDQYNWIDIKTLEGAIDDIAVIVMTTVHGKKVF